MTAPLRDRLAQIIREAWHRSRAWAPGVQVPAEEFADALLTSEEWQAREAVVSALARCESSRGAFSCSPSHDMRCPKARAASANEWKGDWICVCGREALDAAIARLDAVRGKEPDNADRIEALKVQEKLGDRLVVAVVAWLDENTRRCGHGCIHVTCGDCCPVKLS